MVSHKKTNCDRDQKKGEKKSRLVNKTNFMRRIKKGQVKQLNYKGNQSIRG